MIGNASVVPPQRTGDAGPEAAPVSAVERYKEVVALADQSVNRMRERDRERIAELVERLAASQDRVAALIEQEELTRFGVRLLWDAAVEALWEERWMRMPPLPEPEESVPPRDQRDYLVAMDVAYQALEDLLQKRGLLRRKGSA
ncbi:hypothetical protein [Saccharothrix australiensis]|uniref:Uncharacterized protein n=1 Tax=Saccharothrix australiensis TaxID=2072 RepID=A0A495VV68_9PSEU|nr:hypothetical protein [Saccharothrix australiensis]RKT52373.1 hypothetical protein C8E97_0883 [Saccharothrix australiensis]